MIHLIVGKTGAGKTTYAKQLKKETKAVLFSIDKWNKLLFLPDKKPVDKLEWMLDRIERSESVIMDLIAQLERTGVDSILDLGLAKRSHRQKFRDYAEVKGFETKLHYIDVPRKTRLGRIKARNSQQGDTYEFEVTLSEFNFMEDWFEKPDELEMENAVYINDY